MSVLHMRCLVQRIHAVRKYLCCISILHAVVLICMFYHDAFLCCVSYWTAIVGAMLSPVLCSMIAIHAVFCTKCQTIQHWKQQPCLSLCVAVYSFCTACQHEHLYAIHVTKNTTTPSFCAV